MALYPFSAACSSAPRTPQRLLLAATLVFIGSAEPLHAESPFLRGSAGVTRSTATTANAGDGRASEGAHQDEPAVLALGPRTVTVAPGANAILELAIDHLNRIATFGDFRHQEARA
ncbi:MAG: hypothetical protein VBE63_23780 [Lamprobacter sp.]|uniref:hypothetical protein n=1 Tax=Lamprobacter sp. TaxID=3100796 RepID=UPI002B262528|nr:hypothetical protein [Lamprobacter sp.]MEA3642936.1 hypothetical protein [Lamprobacter sp.]